MPKVPGNLVAEPGPELRTFGPIFTMPPSALGTNRLDFLIPPKEEKRYGALLCSWQLTFSQVNSDGSSLSEPPTSTSRSRHAPPGLQACGQREEWQVGFRNGCAVADWWVVVLGWRGALETVLSQLSLLLPELEPSPRSLPSWWGPCSVPHSHHTLPFCGLPVHPVPHSDHSCP